MPGAYLWAWDSVSGAFKKVLVDASGHLQTDVLSTALPTGAATEITLDLVRAELDGIETLLAGGLPAALDTLALKVREQGEPIAKLKGYDSTGEVWRNVLVDATGRLIIDPSAILEDTPTNGEVEKAPTSNWAYDHEHNVSNPHSVTAAQAVAIPDGADEVKDTHVDWGSGTGQVDADDVPESATKKWAGETGADVTANNAPQAHGADKHTDVTRELFIPPGNYYTGQARYIGKHDVISLDPDTDEVVHFEFKVPDDFVSFGDFYVVWISHLATGTDGFDWRCGFSAQWAASGESHATHAEIRSTTIDVADQRIVYATDLTTVAFTGLATGDYVGVLLGRDADHAEDTYEKDIDIIGIVFTYTAEQ